MLTGHAPEKGSTAMDCPQMVEKLKKAGMAFAPGLSRLEIQQAEAAFGFRFPAEIAAFLNCACPVGEDFFDYRDRSPENIRAFQAFQQRIEDAFLFDIAKNTGMLRELLGDKGKDCEDPVAFRAAVMTALHQSPRLIPFYANRGFLDGMDGMPILSFMQAVDTIVYGSDFENYLENEFLDPENYNDYGEIPDAMAHAGIWNDLIERE